MRRMTERDEYMCSTKQAAQYLHRGALFLIKEGSYKVTLCLTLPLSNWEIMAEHFSARQKMFKLNMFIQCCSSIVHLSRSLANLPKASFDRHWSCSSLSTVRLSGNDEISQAIFSLLRYKQTPSGHTQVSQAEQASPGARVDLATLWHVLRMTEQKPAGQNDGH